MTSLCSWHLCVKKQDLNHPTFGLFDTNEVVLLFYVRFKFFIAKYTVLRWKSPNIGNFIQKLWSLDDHSGCRTRMKAIIFLVYTVDGLGLSINLHAL